MRPSICTSPCLKFPGRAALRLRAAAGLLFLGMAAWASAQIQPPVLLEAGQGGGAASNAAAGMASIGGLTDEPLEAGQVVHVSVFSAPDFAVNTRISEAGDIAFPYLGRVHLAGMDSAQAADAIAAQLKTKNLVLDPHVMVTVESFTTGITVLGEVRAPGVYPLPGKRLLSDVIATAGGVTANTGRVIEISNPKMPDKTEEIPWDPTMHHTESYDRPVRPGDRVLVRSCGIAYIGGHVTKPGAYSLCGSQQITLSELVSLAGGTTPYTADRHVYIVRQQANGTRAAQEVNLAKVLAAKAADPVINEDDIVYITPSAMKDAINRATTFALNLTTTLFYVYGGR